MKTRLLAASVATVAATTFLTACGSSPTAASSANFERAIDNYLAAQSCIAVPVPTSFTDNAFPLKLSVLFDKVNPSMGAELDALTQAGLLHGEPGTMAQPVMWGNEKTSQATVYTPTAAGKAAQNPQNPMMFCAGKYHVTKVDSFNKPENVGSTPVTKVFFTYGATDIAAWAHDEGLNKAYPSLAASLGSGQKGTAVMVLKDNGWSVSGTRMPADAPGF